MRNFKLSLIFLFLSFFVLPLSLAKDQKIVYSGSDPYYIHQFPDPVNVRNGNLYLPSTDVSINVADFTINFERFYNSLASGQASPIGYGWRHNFMTKITDSAGPVAPAIIESDGFQTRFWPSKEMTDGLCEKILTARKKYDSDSGQQKSQQFYNDFKNRLSADNQYLFQMLKDYFPNQKTAPLGTYVSSQRIDQVLLKEKGKFIRSFGSGNKEYYDFKGNLIKIEDRNSNYLSLIYLNGRLTAIADRMGLSLNISYNQEGKISSLEDPLGRIFKYFYDRSGNLIKTVGFAGEIESYTYDPQHKIEGIVLASGGKVKIEYDKVMRVAMQTGPGSKVTQYKYGVAEGIQFGEVIDTQGGKTVFQFDKKENKVVEINPLGYEKKSYFSNVNGQLIKTVDEAGLTTNFIYDDNDSGNLVKIVDPKGYSTTYAYGGPFNQITSIAVGSRETKFSYDSRGNMISKVTSLGDKFSYSYDEHGNLVKMTNPKGHSVIMKYDRYANISELLDPLGNVTRIESDPLGRILKKTDPLGGTLSFTYDNANNTASMTDQLGRTVKMVWNQFGKLEEIADSRGAKTKYAYDEAGLLVSQVGPLGQKSSYSYDPRGNLTLAVDPESNRYIFKYDPLDRLIMETNPLGQTASNKYDRLGNLLSRTNEEGVTESYAYDELGRVTKVINPSGKEENFTYGPDTVVKKDSNGNATSLKYDTEDRLIQKIIPEGTVYNYSYDFDSKLVQERSSNGKFLKYAYDPVGRLIEIRNSNTSLLKYAYDQLGNIMKETDANGSEWLFKYDLAGYLSEATNPLGGKISLKYNSQGDITQITDPLGKIETFRYNPLGRLISRISGNGSIESYKYDSLGRITAKETTAEGAKLFYEYDRLGNLLKIKNAKNIQGEFEYDALGRIVAAKNEQSSFAYRYDNLGRITQEKDVLRAKELNFSYDDTGNLSGIYDGKTPLRRYSFDKFNRLSQVKDELGKVYKLEYDSENRLANLFYPNGIKTNYKWDSSDRIASMISSLEGKEIFGAEYQYDPLGNLLKEKSSFGGKNYSYDKMGRLVQALPDQGEKFSYQYDPSGNRVSETSGSNSKRYEYDGNLNIRKSGDVVYDSDPSGNIKSKSSPKGTLNFSWNPLGQLSKVEKNGQTLGEIGYDPFGRKYSYSKANSKTYFRHYGFNPLTEEDSNGNIVKSYVYSPQLDSFDFPLALLEKAKSFYPILDAQGNVVKVTNEAGKVLESIQYEPFGKPTNTKLAFLDSLAFGARPFDRETGLSDFRYRYYDSDTGRFISKDPLSPATGLNPYLYPSNNPFSQRDPLGLVSFSSKSMTPKGNQGSTSSAEPPLGPTYGSTTTSSTSTSAKTTALNTPSLFGSQKFNLGTMFLYQVGIPWGIQKLGKIMKQNLSDIALPFAELPAGAANPLAGALMKVSQKIFKVDSILGKGGSGTTVTDPTKNLEQFKLDLATMSGEDLMKKYPSIKVSWLDSTYLLVNFGEGKVEQFKCQDLEKLKNSKPYGKTNVYHQGTNRTGPDDPRLRATTTTTTATTQNTTQQQSSSGVSTVPAGSRPDPSTRTK